MSGSDRPEWLQGAVQAVELWHQVLEAEQQAKAGRQPASDVDGAANLTRLGAVTTSPARGTGWFAFPAQGKTNLDERLEGAVLAPQRGPAQQCFRIIETDRDERTLFIRVLDTAPQDGLYLWGDSGGSPLQLAASLLKQLRRLPADNELARRVGTGQPSQAPRPVGGPSELDAHQQRAWAACVGPGLQLVWGPPGTGKTRVIAHALQTLIERNKTVLLVSGTNIAVDNALAGAIEQRSPGPGVVVRVGTPHTQVVRDNPDVCLAELIRRRQAELHAKRNDLEARLEQLRGDPAMARLERVRGMLSKFDPDELRRARGRAAEVDHRARIEAQARDLDGAVSQAQAVSERAELTKQRARRAYEQTETVRRLFKRIDELENDLRQRMSTRDDLIANQLALESELERNRSRLSDLASGGVLARLRSGRERREGEARVVDLEHRLASARSSRADAEEICNRKEAEIRPKVAKCGRDAAPLTREEISRRRAQMDRSEQEARSAAGEYEARVHDREQFTAKVEEARRIPDLTAEEIELIGRAEELGFDRLQAEVPRLEQAATGVMNEIGKVEREHDALQKRIADEGRDATKTIIQEARVVATTLARSHLMAAVNSRRFDHVIVDEAAFASVPDLIHAASLAADGVTLLGDFLQNGPIEPPELKQVTDRDSSAKEIVEAWYGRDCFEICGVTAPHQAQEAHGCVTLRAQRRFGPVIAGLANDAVYDGVLRNANDGRKVPEPEVVLIDTDGLGTDLVDIVPAPKGAGRQSAGHALIAKALAERHENLGQSVGVVTPYKAQAGLITDFIGESGDVEMTEVGTSHAFQGREFDTVVLDMVEDGGGWIAKGRVAGDSFKRAGLRLFNVGLTRARDRLYVIGNQAIIERSGDSPALAALQKAIRENRLLVCRAADLLGVTKTPRDAGVGDVWDALRRNACWRGSFDQFEVLPELIHRVREATDSIWLWSPWVAKRAPELTGPLVEAQERGVRVHVVVRPPEKVAPQVRPFVHAVDEAVDNVVFMDKEHEKLVIIDERLTFSGSMNVLSHQAGSRGSTERMLLFDSRYLASELLRAQQVSALRSPPECDSCRSPARVAFRKTVRSGDGRPSPQWYWRCEASADRQPCGFERSFQRSGSGKSRQ